VIDFEHLIQINDRRDPLVQPLSRGQLWRGLLARAERPQLFVLGLQSCEILQREPSTLQRHLSFGSVQVRDRVHFEPMQSVTQDVEPGPGVAACRLTIRIEEPQQGDLFLRFKYEVRNPESKSTTHTQTETDRFYAAHLKQAYLQADRDSVRVIRELAAQGALGAEDE
jgi:hypothetical protein